MAHKQTEIDNEKQIKAVELLKAMLYIMQKNEGEIQMNMPESLEYDKALKFIRENEKL
jgi:hypothetical protein